MKTTRRNGILDHAQTWLQSILTGMLAAALASSGGILRAAEAQVGLETSGTELFLHVVGDEDDDWRIQASTDLLDWSTLAEFGTLISNPTNAPARSLGPVPDGHHFFRALKTSGLYDDTLIRTFSLTFTQANWQTLMANGRTTGSNVLTSLSLDNGATNSGVGARYKGNTSYTGFGGGTPAKKSVNIQLDHVDAKGDLMGYETVNLNNAYGDETIMREPVYFNVMHRYAPSPKGSMARLYINGQYWGVYSLAQQEDGDLIDEWFPSNSGDRWRTPNIGGGTGGGGPGGGGGGFGGSGSALSYLGASVTSYRSNYELKKSADSTNAWLRLVHACNVLNNTPAAELRDKVEDVLAVDQWLWFLAVENIFADDDSYWNKGADYGFYYEPESGRIHPVEHDGNEAFVAGDVQLSPVQGATSSSRPVLFKLLPIPELRQRYLAHMRTILEESFHPSVLTEVVQRFHTLTVDDIAADTRKGFTMTAYTNDLKSLKTFITNRYKFLTNHAELRPIAPNIAAVSDPASAPAGAPAIVTAQIQSVTGEAIDSAWLYFRAGPVGKFSRSQMFDDGVHGDGAAGDGLYGGETGSFVAGTRVRYYVEARAGNAAKAARFSPARAELDTYSFRVTTSAGTTSPVVINEFLADNAASLADPQGEFDDWIELRNVSAEEIDLTGHYLSDNANEPRKWRFPDGTRIAAGAYLLIWADEDSAATEGLHASFRLSKGGEEIVLVGPDSESNALLDSIVFGAQETDRSFGRSPDDASKFIPMTPTAGRANGN